MYKHFCAYQKNHMEDEVMEMPQMILGILLGIVSLVLVAIVMAQPGKDKGLSSAIGGGSSDTYFGKANSVSKEKVLSTITVILCVTLFALLLALVCVTSATHTH